MWGRRQLDTEAGERRLPKPRADADTNAARRAQGDMSGCADSRRGDEQPQTLSDAREVLTLRVGGRLPPVYTVERSVAIVISQFGADVTLDGCCRRNALTFLCKM